MMTFMRWFLLQDFGDTPEADLQRDVKRFDNPIETIGTSYEDLEAHMLSHSASTPALEALKSVYELYKQV